MSSTSEGAVLLKHRLNKLSDTPSLFSQGLWHNPIQKGITSTDKVALRDNGNHHIGDVHFMC